MTKNVLILFKKVAVLLIFRRKWLALRVLINAINVYFDLKDSAIITQAKFLKQVVNVPKFNGCLFNLDSKFNHTGYFMHHAQIADGMFYYW